VRLVFAALESGLCDHRKVRLLFFLLSLLGLLALFLPSFAIAFVVIVSVFIVSSAFLRRLISFELSDLCIILLLIAGTLTSVFAPVQHSALNRLAGLFVSVLVYYNTLLLCRYPRNMRMLLMAIALIGVSVSLSAPFSVDWDIAQVFELPFYRLFPPIVQNIPGSGIPRHSNLLSPREVGGFLSVILAVLVVVSLCSYRMRLFYLVSVSIMVAALLLTQTILAIFALLAATLTLAIISVPQKRRHIVILFALFLLIFGSLSTFMAEIFETMRFSWRASVHLSIISLGLRAFFDSPWLGVGLNNFPFVASCVYMSDYPPHWLAHAHNLFVQTALDFGVIGLIAFLLLTFQTSKYILSILSRPSAPYLCKAFSCGIIAYYLFGLADAIVLGSKAGLIFWLLLAAVRSYADARRVAGVSRRFILSLAFFFVACLPVLYVSYPPTETLNVWYYRQHNPCFLEMIASHADVSRCCRSVR